jgi:predicted transcriptional regulator
MSEAETEVMKALWEHGPGTVREVHELLGQRGQTWAYSTVITLLGRLERKGYVVVDKSEFAHVFRAAVSWEEVVSQRLAALAEELCGGDPAPLVLAFAQQHRFSAKEIEQFRQMIEAMEARRRKRPPGSK